MPFSKHNHSCRIIVPYGTDTKNSGKTGFCPGTARSNNLVLVLLIIEYLIQGRYDKIMRVFYFSFIGFLLALIGLCLLLLGVHEVRLCLLLHKILFGLCSLAQGVSNCRIRLYVSRQCLFYHGGIYRALQGAVKPQGFQQRRPLRAVYFRSQKGV